MLTRGVRRTTDSQSQLKMKKKNKSRVGLRFGSLATVFNAKYPLRSSLSTCAACVFIFILALILVHVDQTFSEWVHHGLRPWQYLIKPVTQLGNGKVLLCFYLSLLGFLLVKKRFRWIYLPFLGAIAFVFSGLINHFLKYLFGRPRPYLADDPQNTFLGFDQFFWFHSDPDFRSFPSGHSAAIFSAAWVLCLLPLKPKWKYVFFTVAFIVAFTRVALGKHFFADIFAGAAVGIFGAQLILDLYYKLCSRKPHVVDVSK